MAQQFLDQKQYTRRGILRYEAIFGRTFCGVGGEDSTAELAGQLHLRPGMKVLDIGCGQGGSAFYMARKYGVDVHGVDLATHMIELAQEYRDEMEAQVKHRVQFYVEDCTSMDYPTNFYDVIYSRDTILHIEDKEELFRKLLQTLKPGGRLLITDYCKGEQAHGREFLTYVAERGYHLHTVREYGGLLERAGFTQVEAEDKSSLMVDILKRELEQFTRIRKKFVAEFSQEDFDYISKGWQDKQVRCLSGDQAWGLFTATK